MEAGTRFLRDALALLLTEAGFAAVSAEGHGQHAGADVVLLQVSHAPDESVRSLVSDARDRHPGARILFLVSAPSGCWDSMASALDVAGWVSCEGSYSRVASAVAETYRSGVLRPHASDRAAPREAEDKVGHLLAHVTSREGEILQRLVEGQSTDHIACDLSISPQTVRAHVQNLMAKLGVHSRVQVVRLARTAGMSPSTVGGLQ